MFRGCVNSLNLTWINFGRIFLMMLFIPAFYHGVIFKAIKLTQDVFSLQPPCEHILVNFLAAHLTKLPPVKVRPVTSGFVLFSHRSGHLIQPNCRLVGVEKLGRAFPARRSGPAFRLVWISLLAPSATCLWSTVFSGEPYFLQCTRK